ncbi:Contactin-associated protein 1 [Varanus komodoensis]|nr:Contactin-associated protein 1 [Varanus komodoensis]
MGGRALGWLLVFAALLQLRSCGWFTRRCDDELIGPLYTWNLGASSRSSIFRAATFARLYGAGGWSPDPQDKQPWLQIDLTKKAHIKSIATQGVFNTYNWVTRYIVLYGDHPSNWKPYFQRGSNWVREEAASAVQQAERVVLAGTPKGLNRRVHVMAEHVCPDPAALGVTAL